MYDVSIYHFQAINNGAELFFIFTIEGSIGIARSYHPMAIQLHTPQPADLTRRVRIPPVQSVYAQPSSRQPQVTQNQLPRHMFANAPCSISHIFRKSFLIAERGPQMLGNATIL